MNKQYHQVWENFLEKNYFPTHVRNVVEIEFSDFTDMVWTNQTLSEKCILDFLAGDVFIIKNVLDYNISNKIKKDVYEYGKTIPEQYLQANTTIPNFHHTSDYGVVGGYTECAHSYIFWRWNPDNLDIFKSLNDFWDTIKIFNGLGQHGLKDNLPEDKIIDRVQILHYPINVGKITPHCDVARWQKTNVAVSLTEKGTDYEDGGLYCINKDEQKVEIESRSKIGDAIVWLPSVFHGVDEPKGMKNDHQCDMEGRWQLLAQGIQSWCIKERVVSVSYDNFKEDPQKVLEAYIFNENGKVE